MPFNLKRINVTVSYDDGANVPGPIADFVNDLDNAQPQYGGKTGILLLDQVTLANAIATKIGNVLPANTPSYLNLQVAQPHEPQPGGGWIENPQQASLRYELTNFPGITTPLPSIFIKFD